MATFTPDDFQAMLQAANAAQTLQTLQTLQAQQSSSSTSLPVSDNFKEASRMVRQPDPFRSEDHDSDLSKWQDFCVNLKAWLFLETPNLKWTCTVQSPTRQVP